MKILVTGANGFIGKNLVKRLENLGYTDILCFGRENTNEELKAFCNEADYIFHLAGVNRPLSEEEFTSGNTGLTRTLTGYLMECKRSCPVVITSSAQAELDNPYGISKREAEEAVYEYGQKSKAPVLIYRMPNVFGKWSKPEYNSAVATFCHNISRGLPIKVNDANHPMTLLYIDDLLDLLTGVMRDHFEGKKIQGSGERLADLTCPQYKTTLGHIADTIQSFPKMRESLEVPDLSDPLVSKLYSTYLSFLPKDGFAYKLKMNKDVRGSFTEFLRSDDRGQISVNITHPGITKGQHWHDSKNEKFLVVKGEGLIRFRRIGDSEVTEYHVNGDDLTVVDIPTGYTHSIINEGEEDLVTLMWANEAFDPDRPDTYREEV